MPPVKIKTNKAIRRHSLRLTATKAVCQNEAPLNRNNKNAPNFNIEGCCSHDAYLRSTKLLGRHFSDPDAEREVDRLTPYLLPRWPWRQRLQGTICTFFSLTPETNSFVLQPMGGVGGKGGDVVFRVQTTKASARTKTSVPNLSALFQKAFKSEFWAGSLFHSINVGFY